MVQQVDYPHPKQPARGASLGHTKIEGEAEPEVLSVSPPRPRMRPQKGDRLPLTLSF